jgi:uncharacterized membrane protein
MTNRRKQVVGNVAEWSVIVLIFAMILLISPWTIMMIFGIIHSHHHDVFTISFWEAVLISIALSLFTRTVRRK